MAMKNWMKTSTTSTKPTAYTRMGAAAVAPGKEDLAGATGKYCEDDVEEEDEEGEEVVIRDVTETQGDDPADEFEALFKSLSSSSPTLRLDAWHHYGSGHMMYVRDEDRVGLSRDIRAFIRGR